MRWAGSIQDAVNRGVFDMDTGPEAARDIAQLLRDSAEKDREAWTSRLRGRMR